MKRRKFISLLGGAVAWPLTAIAQQRATMRRLSVLMHATESDPATVASLIALTKALRETGWVDGRDIQIDHYYSDGVLERLADLAKKAVANQPDVIFTRGTPPTIAILNATHSVPVVFVDVSDPVGSGFAASLSHPGSNVTGFTNYEPSMAGKWLELLREIAPTASHRVAVIFNRATAVDAGRYFLHPLEEAARSMRLNVIAMPIKDISELPTALDNFAHERGGGLVVIPDLFNSQHHHQIIAHAAVRRLPAVYSFPLYVQSGGLISYGVDVRDQSRRAASYVDRILKGAKPADLPIQTPTKFELVINLKTANAIGLAVPATLLARADAVIE
jgi:putative tryptophan/tyrosine transport system substrate-binding protein